MRILVVGAGAIGGYFGGRLLQGGQDVTFLHAGPAAGRPEIEDHRLPVQARDADLAAGLRLDRKVGRAPAEHRRVAQSGVLQAPDEREHQDRAQDNGDSPDRH